MAPLGVVMLICAVSGVLFGGAKGRATYLRVPFAEKSQAKALGARWDSRARSWYVPPGVSTERFGRWLRTVSAAAESSDSATPYDEDQADGSSISWAPGFRATLFSPIYVVESFSWCSTCRVRVDVKSIAAESSQIEGEYIDDLVLPSNIKELPAGLAAEIAKRCPQYSLGYDRTGSEEYYVNRCGTCQTAFDDLSLHDELGEAFCPRDAQAASRIILRRLPVTGRFPISARFSMASPNLIEKYARRLPG
jgi:hypothetical protein